MPAVPLAQASTFYRIRTSSPSYTGYLADSKVTHPQSLPADIPARALVTIQNPVDPAAHWRLSGAPISYRGEWRFRFVNRATGLCLSAYTVVNQGLVPAVRPCRGWDKEKWSLLIGGTPLRNMPTPGAYQFKNADAQCVGRWSLPAHSQPARGEWDPAGHLRLLPDPNPLAMGAAPAVHGSVGPERDQNPRPLHLQGRGGAGVIRLGVADHLGWAIAVAASADHRVVDRRRIELIEPGMTAAPIHYESRRLDVAATAALVAEVRASVVRATSAALDEIATAVPAPVDSISLRTWPLDFPDEIAVQRRAPYESRADAIMYRQELSELAHARAGGHLYEAKAVVGQAVGHAG